MIKRDLNFLKKYEKETSGRVIVYHSWIIVSCWGIQESHKIPEISFNEKICFTLESFLKAFKGIHGSRHSFIITEEGLEVTVKKTGKKEFYSLEKDKDISLYMDEIVLNHCLKGTMSAQNLVKVKMFEKLNTNMDYIKFLKNPFIILGLDSYIWGTDCIHQLRIDMAINTKKVQFYKTVGYFKWISEWASEIKGNIDIYVDSKENKIAFSNDCNMIISDIEEIEETYTCQIPLTSSKYTLYNDELNQLKCLHIEKLVSAARATVKSGIEIYIEIIHGELSINKKPFFTLKNQITIPNKINGYRFVEFIKDSDELILTDKYLQSHNSYLIL